MKYTPHTQSEIEQMLAEIGVSSTDELFNDIADDLRAKSFDLPKGMSEFELIESIKKTFAGDKKGLNSFLGAGFYDHYIPAVVDMIAGRSEFYSPYTPYQPEVAQGLLQTFYEYQTSICELTDMEVSNASLYDGGTALAEAALMGLRITKKKNNVVIDHSVNPMYREIIKTALANIDCNIVEVPFKEDLSSDIDALINAIDGNCSSVLVQNPNFFGSIADFSRLADALHENKSVLSVSVNPISLGLIKTPGEMGADIVTGEGQPLGNPLNFGGPYLGIIATTKKHIRNLPGRIVGETVDKEGRRSYVLTLQAREQHIRRQKATSNICSNQGLCVVRAAVYMALLGKNGMSKLAQRVFDVNSYARRTLDAVDGVDVMNSADTFNEFVIKTNKNANELSAQLLKEGTAPGLPLAPFYKGLENCLLVSVTEKKSKAQIDALAAKLEAVL